MSVQTVYFTSQRLEVPVISGPHIGSNFCKITACIRRMMSQRRPCYFQRSVLDDVSILASKDQRMHPMETF
jgi:hypothetical protein